jgi:hypothetical protein
MKPETFFQRLSAALGVPRRNGPRIASPRKKLQGGWLGLERGKPTLELFETLESGHDDDYPSAS